MSKHKFTVFLIPEEGYQAIVPNYPEASTWGENPEHAFAMAQESLELALEVYAETHQEQVLLNSCASHAIVGTIEAEVPDVLLKDVRAAEAELNKEEAAAMV